MRLLIVLYLMINVSFELYSQQEKNDQIRFSIYFGGGSYYIDEEQSGELKEFLIQFDSFDEYQISVHSHTDNIGGKEYNQWLSQMRSRAAINELINNDVPEVIISIQDFGPFNPVYDNSTWMGRLKNRRVDIIFWPIVL